MEVVKLKCFKIQNKLRVRITSPGYNNEANCQFPRAIRKEGKEYTVPVDAITFSEGANRKFFYRIRKKDITVIEGDIVIDKVFGDEDIDMDCIVCMDKDKSVVFAPCGHYCCCGDCATKVKNSQGKCVLCRKQIAQIVQRDQIQ